VDCVQILREKGESPKAAVLHKHSSSAIYLCSQMRHSGVWWMPIRESPQSKTSCRVATVFIAKHEG